MSDLAGLPYQVNPELPKGTARLHGSRNDCMPWLEVDSTDTVRRIVDELNKRESEYRAWLDQDFLQACGIEVIA